jgi:hypothetical protein
MIPPQDANVVDTIGSKYWFDDMGIMCAVVKKGLELSADQRRAAFSDFRNKMGEQKICMIVDITDSAPIGKEIQNFNLQNFPKVFKAIAFISRSAYSRMLGHLYLGMHSNPFPYKIFSNEKDAREWIRQYL